MTRIVIENVSAMDRVHLAEIFGEAGYDVSTCGGPSTLRGGRCPLVTDGGCPMIEGADLVFFDLDLDREDSREVLHSLRSLHPELPVVVEAPEAALRAHHELLVGCEVVLPYDAESLLAGAARAALSS
jgi:hypothetical protein